MHEVAMLILPRSNPLYENIPVQKINLPEALKKMGAGGFTGYLGFGSSHSEGYFIFIKGSLISVLMLEGTLRKNGFDAITSLFRHVSEESGVINVYRMTVDLAVCAHALLHGTPLLKPEPVAGLDLKSVFARMKTQLLNGTVLFSTPERSAMIFYKEGTPIGFYHDAAQDIESSPAESQRVAALPGATIEILSSQPAGDLLHHNLLETLNIDRLWQAAQNRLHTSQAMPDRQSPPAQNPPKNTKDNAVDEALLNEIVDDLREIASAYLSRQGAALVDRLLETAGGKAIMLDIQKASGFFSAMTEHSVEIDQEAKIEEMVDLMRSELAGRLSI
jgi:hypothetical protein